ncbi:carbonic anhydrase 9-like [Triplophysa dalaica]|uniref:carbonic anhydrase 9-like n=1 Tax=Triplophysa dalaica TaxID=1582913 RepID=UPI0024DF9C3A|nr:carbonic anhydrase 9-like [Triplophysa dalaica]
MITVSPIDYTCQKPMALSKRHVITAITLHVVHIKQKYSNLTEAFQDQSGLAVFGFFLEESNSDNKNFDNLINVLRSIENKSGDVSIRNISASQFILPEENMTSYYRYNGSLTAPNCSESVIWTVFEKTIPLSKKQVRLNPNQSVRTLLNKL